MTRDETAKLIPIMQAFVDGAEIECQVENNAWFSTNDPAWGYLDYKYRIKKTPRTFWIYPHVGLCTSRPENPDYIEVLEVIK